MEISINSFIVLLLILQDEEAAELVATPDLQQRVLEATVLHPACRLYPPALSYRAHFLKQLVQKVGFLNHYKQQ